MLILSRKCNEKVVFGDNNACSITILGVQGNQVKLGFDAPKSVPIFREELLEGKSVLANKAGENNDA